MSAANHALAFDELVFVPNSHGGIQARTEYPNGYGASVVRSPYSYGGDAGLYELAVLCDGRICYDTPITDDVLGHLSESGVGDVLQLIAALPAKVLS